MVEISKQLSHFLTPGHAKCLGNWMIKQEAKQPIPWQTCFQQPISKNPHRVKVPRPTFAALAAIHLRHCRLQWLQNLQVWHLWIFTQRTCVSDKHSMIFHVSPVSAPLAWSLYVGGSPPTPHNQPIAVCVTSVKPSKQTEERVPLAPPCSGRRWAHWPRRRQRNSPTKRKVPRHSSLLILKQTNLLSDSAFRGHFVHVVLQSSSLLVRPPYLRSASHPWERRRHRSKQLLAVGRRPATCWHFSRWRWMLWFTCRERIWKYVA